MLHSDAVKTRPGRRRIDQPNPIDVHVGARVRLRRTALRLSQAKLGKAVGVTFQQVQKYERGTDRLAASRLFEFAHVLDVPITFFFEEADRVRTPAVPEGLCSTQVASPDADPLCSSETTDLLRAFYAIGDPRIRRTLHDLAKALSRAGA